MAMAMQMPLSRASSPSISSIGSPLASSSWSSTTVDLLRSSSSSSSTLASRRSVGVSKNKNNKGGVRVTRVRSSLEMVGPVVGQVTEVNKDTFWPLVKAAAEKTVVLDMYTQWCGPCKVMAPKYQELSKKYSDVVFFKLDCNQENKALAKELGIRVVPTFKILKDNKVVKEVTGAKFENLVAAIESVRSS